MAATLSVRLFVPPMIVRSVCVDWKRRLKSKMKKVPQKNLSTNMIIILCDTNGMYIILRYNGAPPVHHTL